MGSTHSRLSSPPRAMIGDSIEGFPTASHEEGEGRPPLSQKARYGGFDCPCHHHIAARDGRTPITPLSDGALIRRGYEHKPTLNHPMPSRRQHSGGTGLTVSKQRLRPGRPTHRAMTPTQGGKDPDDRLRPRPSSGQERGPHR
jgi:hypothetical protein